MEMTIGSIIEGAALYLPLQLSLIENPASKRAASFISLRVIV
jgi:hypothetical protein